MTDLVQRLRDSVTQARAVDRSALLAEAADEIERLRGRPASGDIVTRLRQTRANMIGTDDEAHYWDCHDAAAEIEKLRRRLRLADAALRCNDDTRPSPACGAPHAAIHGDDGRPRDAGAATSHHAASGPGPELLSERLRIFADDKRLDAMPMKFRMTMRDAAREIERLHITDAEREAIEWGAEKSEAESHIAKAAAERGYIPEIGGDPRQWARNHAARAAALRALLDRIGKTTKNGDSPI